MFKHPLMRQLTTEFLSGQTIVSLDAVAADAEATSMLRFETIVHWQEKHKFLKWEVPLEIFSSEAFYETQYGYISRPTHRNTTWDAAKFEVCGHKYIDLSEYGYGVAMLNDCKYGFAVAGESENRVTVQEICSSACSQATQCVYPCYVALPDQVSDSFDYLGLAQVQAADALSACRSASR